VPSPRSASHSGRGGSMAIRDASCKPLWHALMPFVHLPSRHAARAKSSAWIERLPVPSAAGAAARRLGRAHTVTIERAEKRPVSRTTPLAGCR
jgi:hypothetical protein